MVNIQIESLSVRLGKQVVLNDVSAQFGAGEFVGIIGPNGAGKSTLVRSLFGLIPLNDGSISINHRPLGEWRKPDLAKTMAYLPQGHTLHWPIQVERLVQLGRLPHQPSHQSLSAIDQIAIESAITRANIGDLRHRIATELSGGERARVLLARALAVNADALIVDEPLASLDPGHQLDVMSCLHTEAKAGKLVVAVLHDLNLAARFCDRLLLLSDGQTFLDGPPEAVLTAEALHHVYGLASQSIQVGGTQMLYFQRPLSPS